MADSEMGSGLRSDVGAGVRQPTDRPGAERQSALHLGEWEAMLEEVVLLAFCALVALLGLALVLWEVASGRLLSLDSLTLTFICLTLVVIFGGNLAWAVYNGDVKRILNHLRKRPAESEIKKENP